MTTYIMESNQIIFYNLQIIWLLLSIDLDT